MGSFITLGTIQTALELGVIYSLVALALFLSFSMLNVCDLSTDSCFTLGCAVGSMVAIAGHPILAIFAAMGAGILSGYLTALLQTKTGGSRASWPVSSSTPACTPSTSLSWASPSST